MDKIDKKEIKEIMEMRRIICSVCGVQDDCTLDKVMPCVACKELAKALYNAGYGKVEDYKKEIERLKGVIAMTEQHYNPEPPFENEFDEALREAEQQAIKKFAQQLIEKQSCHNVMCQTVCYISEGDVKTLLEEYGIGIN